MSLANTFGKFSLAHVAGAFALAWMFPGAFHWAHSALVTKVASMKAGLAAFAASGPAVPGAGTDILTSAAKSVAGFLSGSGFGASGLDLSAPPAPVPL